MAKKQGTGVVIGEKDIKIIEYLSCGCATFLDLLGHLKKSYKQGQNINHELILRKRLSQLLGAGYIESQIYHVRGSSARQALYILSEPARHMLIESGWHYQKIRGILPNNFTIAHELAVTAIVRAIKKESKRSQYDYRLHDENSLKKVSGGSNKGEFYPDLLVKVMLTISGEQKDKYYYIEYDNGTIPTRDILKKSIKMNSINIFFICATTERMDKLRAGVMNAPVKEKLIKKVFFGLLEDICSMGIYGAKFQAADGKPVGLL